MPSITLGGKSVVTQTTPNQPVIAGNVQFPAGPSISGQTSGGHILQVQQKAYTAGETTL